jgi:hypothetical protein
MFSKKNYAIFSFCFLSAQASRAQYQPPYTAAQQQADINTLQKLPEKAKAKFNYLAPCRENLSPAFVDSLCAWALLDSAGNQLLMPKYNNIELLGGGLVSATRADRQNYWLHKDAKLIPLQYETVTWWAENQLLVSANQQKGIINTSGTGIVPTMYDEIVALPTSLLARRGKTWLRLDPKSGAPLPLSQSPYLLSPQAEATSQYARRFPLKTQAIAWKDNSNYQLIKTNTDKQNADKTNEQILIAPQKYPIHYSGGQIAFLEIEAVFYPYDLNTKTQKNIRYDRITALTADGLWAVAQISNKENKPQIKWGIIDQKGNTLVEIQYDSLVIDSQFNHLIHLAKNNNNSSNNSNNQSLKWGLWQTDSQTWLAKAVAQKQVAALSNEIWAAPNPTDTSQTAPAFYLWHKDSKGQSVKIKAFENKAFEAVRYLSPQYFAATAINTKDLFSKENQGWQLFLLNANPKNQPKNLLSQAYADIKSQKNHLFEVSNDGKNYFFLNLQGKKPACP